MIDILFIILGLLFALVIFSFSGIAYWFSILAWASYIARSDFYTAPLKKEIQLLQKTIEDKDEELHRLTVSYEKLQDTILSSLIKKQ